LAAASRFGARIPADNPAEFRNLILQPDRAKRGAISVRLE
jgi:hypothetical protein